MFASCLHNNSMLKNGIKLLPTLGSEFFFVALAIAAFSVSSFSLSLTSIASETSAKVAMISDLK
jgi:hypothetical protein